MEILCFGIPHDAENPDAFLYDLSRQILSACKAHDQFQVTGLGKFDCPHTGAHDVISVAVHDLSVSSRNEKGIRVSEPLAIVVCEDADAPLQVRALRSDFPECMHMNEVGSGEPKSLCLYDISWADLERTLTPELFLQRIIWWLEKTADGKLHAADQPLEPLFLAAGTTVLLPSTYRKPSNIDQERLVVTAFSEVKPDQVKYVRLEAIPEEQAEKLASKPKRIMPIQISIGPLVHGQPLAPRVNIADLVSELREQRDIDLEAQLKNEIDNIASLHNKDMAKLQSFACVLILRVLQTRGEADEVESVHTLGFYIPCDFRELGQAVGVFDRIDGEWTTVQLLSTTQPATELSQVKASPCEIKYTYDRKDAQILSGVNPERSDFVGMLAGVGALGGYLADIWSKMGWGYWRYADPDYLEPHNPTRHVGKDFLLTTPKVNAVRRITNENYSCVPEAGDYVGDVRDFLEDEAKGLADVDLLVDASTTIAVPRDLSSHDGLPRSATVFLTPTGDASVLLLEDNARRVRLDSLEAQYYRAVINKPWAENLLTHSDNSMQVGAGCRDKSFVLPVDKIQMHAGMLSQKLRASVSSEESVIWIGQTSSEFEHLAGHTIPVVSDARISIQDWTVVIDTEVQKKLKSFRHARLPNETGGILVGYSDQKTKHHYVVDVIPAPEDSEEKPDSFERGTSGLLEKLEDIMTRTSKQVSYIGEWHSHPDGIAPLPSVDDLYQLGFVADRMKAEGKQAMMIIVGENKITIGLGKTGGQLVEMSFAAA